MTDKRLTVDDLSPDQREVYDAMVYWADGVGGLKLADESRFDGKGLLTVGGLAGCLSGDTTVYYNRGARVNSRPISLRDLYLKFNGFAGSGRGQAQRWVDLTVPTFMPSLWPDGSVKLNRVVAVFESGVKKVVRFDFTGGRHLVCTEDHPIAVPGGEFVKAGLLSKGDVVVARGAMKARDGRGRRSWDLRPPRIIVTAKYHPTGSRKTVWCNGIAYDYARVARARLVVEAAMNDLPYDEYVHCLKHNPGVSAGFKTLSRDVEVHHVDEDTLNDDISNLEVLSKAEHARIHGPESEKRWHKEYTRELKVIRRQRAGEEMTYDVQMEPPANNFVANGVFVHNTGKTTLLGVFAATTDLLVAYVTFTGRASSILSRKLKAAGAKTTDKMMPPEGMRCRGRALDLYDPKLEPDSGPAFVGTIHRLLYSPVVDSATEELVGWRKRAGLDRAYDLIVIDECFHHRQRVLTEDGWVEIGKLVRESRQCRVWSRNPKTGDLELKPIVRWLKKKAPDALLKIQVGRTESMRDARQLRCTKAHKILTPTGYVRAGDLKVGDELVVRGRHLTPRQFSVLIGSMLGDGTMGRHATRNSPQPSITQGEAQKQWLEFKRDIFGDMAGPLQKGKSGYGNKDTWRFAVRITDQARRVAEQMPYIGYHPGGTRRWSPTDKFLDWIDPLALTVWFLDNGSLSRVHNARYATLHSERFTREDNERLARVLLEKFGLSPSVKAAGPYFKLNFNEKDTELLLNVVRQWTPLCMLYKVPGAQGWYPEPQTAGEVTTAPVTSITSIPLERSKFVYDLEVADHHNYIAGNVVVSNCSMVGNNMMGDIKAHGVPILAVGDHGQLPPVMDAGDLMKNPDLKLEKIHRQALGSPIIRLAHHIRETGKFDMGSSGGDERVVFRSKSTTAEIIAEAFKAAQPFPNAFPTKNPLDVGILCWTNRSRVQLNATARKALGFAGPPKKGEVVIALKNKPPVYNGMRGVLTADASPFMNPPWLIGLDVEFPDEGLSSQLYDACAPQFCREKLFSSVEELKERGMPGSFAQVGSLWDFGSAMTVHKCVAPETFVETTNGLVFANDLPPIGRVATPTGRAVYGGFVRNGESRMLKITTTDGYELRVTPNHGIDVWSPYERYIRVEAGGLSAGNFLRLRLGAEFDSKPVRLLDGRTPDVRAKLYDLPKMCDGETAEFLGLMVADGTVYHGGFRLAKRHEDVADRFDHLCRRVFGASPSRFFKLNAHHVEVSSTYIADWLSCLGGLSPNCKRVPWCVLQSPLIVQAAFLRGLFEDGTVNLGQTGGVDHIEFSSCEPMVRQAVRTMLLRWGIVCGATASRPECIYIYGQHAKRFGEIIGFVSKMKQERLSLPAAEGTRYVFPLDYEERRKLGREDRIQRHRIQKLDVGLRGRFDDRIGFHHSEVASIEPYVGPSVCIEVPTGHQFLQNGFCGWNSQGSQFSHAIVYLDRPVKPEDEDWRRWAYTAVTRASDRLTVLL